MRKSDENLSIAKEILLPGSLWRDLHAEVGSGNGIEWLLLYEKDPLTIKQRDRLLYVKVVILTEDGRKNAERGQADILRMCNLYAFETATFSRALANAMSEWDLNHPDGI